MTFESSHPRPDAGDQWTVVPAALRPNCYRQIQVRLPESAKALPLFKTTVIARDTIAWLAGDRPVTDRRYMPPEFFNYGRVGEQRRAKEGLSPFRFYGYGQTIGLTAVGPAAVELLTDYGHRLTRLIGEYLQVPCQEKVRSGFVSIQSTEALHSYTISTLGIMRGHVPAEHPWNKVEDPMAMPDLVDAIEKKIVAGLYRQAALLKLTLNEEPLVRIMSIQRMLTITGPFHSLAAGHVSFASDLKLSGPWHVGHGCAKGLGEIRMAR